MVDLVFRIDAVESALPAKIGNLVAHVVVEPRALGIAVIVTRHKMIAKLIDILSTRASHSNGGSPGYPEDRESQPVF